MCEVIKVGDSTAIICLGNHTNSFADHKCNEDAGVYELRTGERIFIKNKEDDKKWYDENYEQVISGSVACSICGHTAIDNAPYL